MIQDLKAIISRAATDQTGSIDRYYYNTRPQKKNSVDIFPYVTYYLIAETYGTADSEDLTGDVKLQFNVFSTYKDYGAQCDNILQEVLDYFDTKFLPYANTSGSVTIISCIRDFTIPAKTPDGIVWQSTVQYNIKALN